MGGSSRPFLLSLFELVLKVVVRIVREVSFFLRSFQWAGREYGLLDIAFNLSLDQ